jgi:cobalt-zinc-cadmium efflux system protein
MSHQHEKEAGHDHGSHAGHSHAHAVPDSSRAFAIGVFLNLGFVIAEFIFGFAANSLALLSDAGHNLSDVFGLLLAWGALHLARTLPSKRYTFGLRRSSILAALANAIILLVVVGGIAWEAVLRLENPQPVASGTVMIVAALGVVINAVSAMLFWSGRTKDINVKGAFLHLAGDAAVSLGVVLAGLVIMYTGMNWIDPAMSLLVSVIIAVGTWGLLKESVNLSMDAVPQNVDSAAVEKYLAALPGVASLHDLHIWAMSTTEVALTVHLVMPEGCPGDKFLQEIQHELEEDFGIGHATIQTERGDGPEPCRHAPPNVV